MSRTKAKYVLISEKIEDQILGMSPNSLLPTEQQLTKRFQVSRGTVRRALSFVAAKGLLSRERGRGTIVKYPKITRQILPICPIEQDLRDQGLTLETQVLQWQPNIVPPDHIRNRLELGEQESVCFLSLIRSVDDRILCHDQRYMSATLGRDFNPEWLSSRPIHYILQDLSNLKIASAVCEVEITPAPFDVARTLHLVPGRPIFVNTFTNYFENGQPAEACVMSYRTDRVKFKFAASGTSMMEKWPAGQEDRPRPGHGA
jgi:GntR family transcriptional regulator